MEIIQNFWFVILLLFSLLGLGLWLEIRKSKERLGLRIGLWFLAILSLFLLILSESDEDTKRYSAVFLMEEEGELSPYEEWLRTNPQVEVISETEVLNKIELSNKQGQTLRVDSVYTAPHRVVFWKQKLPESQIFPANNISILGIYSINNQLISSINEKHCFSVKFPDLVSSFWLYYQGVDRKLDSVFVEQAAQEYAFCEDLKVAGRYTGKLWAKMDNGLQVKLADIPINVLDKRNLSMVMLSSFPSAEWRYLRDFWRKQGHKVRMETGIAIGKSLRTQEAGNEEVLALLMEGKGADTDAWVMQESYFSSLSKAAQSHILLSVNQGFIHLMLFPDKGVFSKILGSSSFALQPNNSSDEYVFSWQGLGQSVQKVPFTFTENWQQSAPPFEGLLAAHPYGKGWVISQLATATYPWLLSGNEVLYEAYWSGVAEWLSPQRSPAVFRVDQDWPVAGRPIQGELIGYDNIEKVQLLHKDTVWYMNTESDMHLSEKHHVSGSIPKAGWWTPMIGEDTLWTSSFYVQNPDILSGLYSGNRTDFSEGIGNDLVSQGLGDKGLSTAFDVSKYRWIFLLSFVILLALLWLLPRI